MGLILQVMEHFIIANQLVCARWGALGGWGAAIFINLFYRGLLCVGVEPY